MAALVRLRRPGDRLTAVVVGLERTAGDVPVPAFRQWRALHRDASLALAWRGLPATGRRVEIPLCGVYTFDENDRLAGERIYYDRATVLQQLGIFHEPQSILGQITTLATHPITITRALGRKLFAK